MIPSSQQNLCTPLCLSLTSFHLGSVVYRYTLVLALLEKKPKESTSNVQ